MKKVLVSIDYLDGDQSSYSGVEIFIDDEDHTVINSNNPVIDWINAMIFIGSIKGKFIVTLSSSVNHFTNDGDRYEWIHISHSESNKTFQNETDDTLKYLVPSNNGIDTYEKLRKYYKKNL